MISMGVPMSLNGLSLRTLAFSMVRCLHRRICPAALQDRAGLLAVPGEVVALLDLVGPLFAGERRLVIGDMADQVEVAVVLADLFGEILQDDAVLFQYSRMACFFVGVVPAPQKFIQ